MTEEARTMEGLLALRSVPLFGDLSLEQLEAVNQAVHEVNYLACEAIVREHDPGDHLYVVVEGEMQFYKDYGTADERLVNTMSPPCYFGEIAIFDGEERSVTVVASKDARLLTLTGDRLKELVVQAPEMAFEIFRGLAQLIRSAEARERSD